VHLIAHFSLALHWPIRDNPALSHSGGTWAINPRTDRERSDRGAVDVPARA